MERKYATEDRAKPNDQEVIHVGIELFDPHGISVSEAEFMEVFYNHAPKRKIVGPARGGGSAESGFNMEVIW